MDAWQMRIERERAAARIASRLLATDDADVADVIRAGLVELGKTFGVDRAYVIALGDTGDQIELAEEWCAPGIDQVERDLSTLGEPLKDWWGERIRSEGIVRIDSVVDLGPEADPTRDLLDREDVWSVVFVPVILHDVLRGAVGMTTVRRHRTFTDDEAELLRVVGGAWVSRLERSRAEQALREATAELELRNSELERSNRELEDFAYVASHDLKSPLLVLRGFFELLAERKDAQEDSEGLRWIEAGMRASDRMEQLIDDLLVFSRAGRRRDDDEIVDLAEVWSQVATDSHASIRAAHATIEVGDLPVIAGDESRLRQLLQNLLSNALKFARPGVAPVIEVGAVRDGDRWVISVSDNGIGVAPEDRERIFAMFAAFDEDGDLPGSGIGLAICQRVVAAHGGNLRVEESPSGGCRFIISLPAL